MTTWLLPPASATTYRAPNGTVYSGTLGVPVGFEDSDASGAVAQGWAYSRTEPLPRQGVLQNVIARQSFDAFGNTTGIINLNGGAALDYTKYQKRQANINAWSQSPIIPAPLRLNTTGYTVAASNETWGTHVRLANGQHLAPSASGTSGGAEPTTYFDGRPITDSGVTWYEEEFIKSTTDLDAPTVSEMLFTNYGTEGLTLTNFTTASGLPSIVSSNDCIVGSQGVSLLTSYSSTIGNSAFTGNATAQVTATNANGFPVANTRNFSYNRDEFAEFSFIVSDYKFALAFFNFGARAFVTIDGKRVQGSPTNFLGASNNGLLFNFNGTIKDRLVTVACNAQLKGIGLTPQGSVRAIPRGTDVCLLLADSHGITASPQLPGQAYMGMYLKRYLGFDGLINASNGGIGYIVKQANQFNALEMLNNVDNVAAWQYLNPSHVIIHLGNNDGVQTASVLQAACIATWRRVRDLFPNAKISICTGFSGATGPSATILTNAATIKSAFQVWSDANSRLIETVGTSAATSQVSGTGTISSAITTAGNSTMITGSDGTHPSPFGARYVARRIANEIISAWNNQY